MNRHGCSTLALIGALSGLAAPQLRAAQAATGPGAQLTVYLATYGPGGAAWEKFGHNAIWIRDHTFGSTTSYNYGMFDMSAAGFYPRFLRGRMLYQMGVFPAEWEAARYAERNRTVRVQRLNLTPAQRFALRDDLERNWAQDSGKYLYDYFRDNCSTRIRDALDRALGGAIRAALDSATTGTTFRSHSLRLTASNAATYTGLLIGLGLPTDRPITAWDEGFIPMRLMDHLRPLRITAADGSQLPLVAEESTHFLASRAPPPDAPPARTPWYLLAGLGLGAALVLSAHRARTSTRARLAWAIATSFWAFAAGLFGLILSLLWLFTDHTAAYPNMNLLQLNPLSFLLGVAAPLAIRRGYDRPRTVARFAWPLALAVAALSIAGLLLHAIPSLRQGSAPIIASALPLHLAVVWSLYSGPGRPPSSRVDSSDRISLRHAA